MKFLISVLLTLALSTATIIRSNIYENEVTMWQDTALKSPNKLRPLNNLGYALKEAERFDEAGPWLERAVAIDPRYPDALNNLAAVYGHQGRREAALALIGRSLELNPNHVQARFNLAMHLYAMGLRTDAARQFDRVIRTAPRGREAAFSRKMLSMIRQSGTR